MELLTFVTFFVLSFTCLLLGLKSSKTKSKFDSVTNTSFVSFQRTFFLVYFMALFGDWLQGPYVYKLYEFYGYQESQIAVLYVVGFASSVLFGTITGPIADMFGRKKSCILFCLIYTFCCLTKLSSNFFALLWGRIFGGIATSLLFASFESWYVCEHVEKHKFPSEWIGVTFSKVTYYNGLLAIIAGVIANLFAEPLGLGPVAPFVIAIIPLIMAAILIAITWTENYGNSHKKLLQSFKEGFFCIIKNSEIFYLGGIQTTVESTMYIFVFLWTPILIPSNPPLGMIFACFMVAIMIGSSCFGILLFNGYLPQTILKFSLYTIGCTLLLCCFTIKSKMSSLEISLTFFAFIILEFAFGIYFPAISLLKSQIIPETYRANVMNWFRLPTNLITCMALLTLKLDIISSHKVIMFQFCALFTVIGLYFVKRFEESYQITQNNVDDDGEEKKNLILTNP